MGIYQDKTTKNVLIHSNGLRQNVDESSVDVTKPDKSLWHLSFVICSMLLGKSMYVPTFSPEGEGV